METISTKNALKPSGHYSQAIIHNDTIYISAQLPIHPETGEKQFGTIVEETERILKNIEIVLNKAGCNRNHIIKATVYITDMSYWNEVNEVFTSFFKSYKPARTIISVKELHFGFKVAIEAIAIKTF